MLITITLIASFLGIIPEGHAPSKPVKQVVATQTMLNEETKFFDLGKKTRK